MDAMENLTESTVEQAALAWLKSLGYTIKNGPDIAPGELGAEWEDYGQVVFEGRLHQALERLNPDLPTEALEDAFRKLINPEGATLVTRNHAVHRMLADGVNVEYKRPDGSIAGTQVNIPKTTTGWPSTSSPLSKTSTTDDRTSCSSSTACRWSSLS